jgi:hypothetical protein
MRKIKKVTGSQDDTGGRTIGLVPRLRRSDPFPNRFPSPSPDFLWNLVALANFMRLSLLKGARAALSSDAWQEIRVPGWADVWQSALQASHSHRLLPCHFSLKLPQASWLLGMTILW